MDAIVIGWRELLLVIVAILAIYIAELLLLTRHRGERVWRFRRKREAVPDPELPALRAEVTALREDMQLLAAEIKEMKSAAAASPYGQAIALAQQGMDAGAVAASCGISRGEAELIIALNRAQTPH